MSQSSIPKSAKILTFQEYLFYQGEPDVLYELFRGHLIPMATPTILHVRICQFLVYQLQRYFATHNLALVAVTTVGIRTEENSSRIPDVVVCSQSVWEQAGNRPGLGVLDFSEVPQLVVEVVSKNWHEDYIRKRAEYALINIPEYWIFDSKKVRIWVLTNPESEEGYIRTEFNLKQEIRSKQFPEFVLSVEQVLSPPAIEDLIREEQAERQQLEQKSERMAAKLREMGIDPDVV
ncbi:Uma2 family endonuclease [Chroococcidiopsis sp. FACHB-1243]|uniref:Uma2 family endonuclease n=1 Tax=Chroococcidiopsis sp. [FACHB-1243] TaxID=2692781 RepID=UPI001781CBCF|nr:Uma2 family endonuclease [Chroococcidiopsis sp. [FACHB-1243]]MBD2303994.1 Uma2 family endonuclease [Chroococcidiopsis sp. [FACHB-1243]]